MCLSAWINSINNVLRGLAIRDEKVIVIIRFENRKILSRVELSKITIMKKNFTRLFSSLLSRIRERVD